MNATAEQTKKNSFQWRIEKGRQRVLNTKPSVDIENAKIMTESFMTTEGEPLVMRKAKAFREQCKRKTIFIQEDELIVGGHGSRIRGGMLCPDVCWSVLYNEQDTIENRAQDPFTITEEDKEIVNNIIKPFWEGKSFYEAWRVRIPEDIAKVKDTETVFCEMRAIRGPGEATPDYSRIINMGVVGIEKEIKDKLATLDLATPEGYDQTVYLNSLLVICEGMKILAKRYAALARELAGEEKDQRRRQELEQIAEVFDNIPENPARNFWEGVQDVYFYQSCILMEQNAVSYNPGRIDQYLYPLYRKSIAEGTISAERAQELLDCLWVKLGEATVFQDELTAKYSAGYMMYQNVSCGGVDSDGQDAVNDLSYMVLQATADVRLYQPSLSVRYNLAKNPDKFLRKIVETVAIGTGFPAIHNDETGIKTILNRGVTLKEAYDWAPCGCVETSLAGKTRTWTGYAHLNLAKTVELVMLNGVDRRTGTVITPQTGNPAEFKSFEEFKSAVKTQIDYLVRKLTEANQVIGTLAEELRPVPVLSLSFEDCIKNGKDYERGGPKYLLGDDIIGVGTADFINSLEAIYKLIYVDKKVTWNQMIDAVNSDFEGYEDLRQMCLNAPKWGNDIDEVDSIGKEMLNYFGDDVRSYYGKYGRMSAGLLPVTSNVCFGLITGALPNGRKAWTTLTDGISPTGGTDVNGPTAVLKSISSFDHSRFENGTLLNMKFDPSSVQNEHGLGNMMSLLKSLCTLGVYHAQFNVVSQETLLDAQKNPQNYRDLLVRVAGYTAFFVELDKAVQDEIISRSTQKF